MVPNCEKNDRLADSFPNMQYTPKNEVSAAEDVVKEDFFC
jgi:hypothetical protein